MPDIGAIVENWEGLILGQYFSRAIRLAVPACAGLYVSMQEAELFAGKAKQPCGCRR
jgi:hypothetical protein